MRAVVRIVVNTRPLEGLLRDHCNGAAGQSLRAEQAFVRGGIKAFRSVLSEQKKLSIAALSHTLPDRLIEKVMPWSAISRWNCSLVYAAAVYRQVLADAICSDRWDARGAESFMKTLKVEAVYRWRSKPSRTPPSIFSLH